MTLSKQELLNSNVPSRGKTNIFLQKKKEKEGKKAVAEGRALHGVRTCTKEAVCVHLYTSQATEPQRLSVHSALYLS